MRQFITLWTLLILVAPLVMLSASTQPAGAEDYNPVPFLVAASNASQAVKDVAMYQADGTADDVQIQAAIDNLPSSGGKVVLSEGTFNITESIELASDMTLEGMGIDSTIISLTSGANVNAIETNTKDHVSIRNLYIDGNKAGQTTEVHGIDWIQVSNGVIDNVKAKELSGNGVRIGAGSTLINITNCRMIDNDWRGVHTAGSANVSIVGCFTKGNGLDGIDVDGFSQDVIVDSNNSRQNGRAGIFVEDNSRDVTVSGNLCTMNGGNGINVNQQLANGATERVTIIGNVCRRNDDHGIRVRANVSTAVVSDITIIGNVITNNGQGGQLTMGITVGETSGATTTDVVISGNRIGNTQEWETQTYGIEIQNGPSNVLVHDNNVVGNYVGGIRDNSQGEASVKDNQGFMTEAAGTAIVSNGSTSVLVTHGLASTPTAGDCSVTPTNSMGDAAKFWADSFGGSTFTIHVDSDPGAGTAAFAWNCSR